MVKRDIKSETETSLNSDLREPVYKEPDFPTFFNQIKSLLGTLNDWKNDSFRLSDTKTWQKRFEICQECTYFRNNRCSKCGCYTSVKAKIKAAECPLDRWSK